ncbi:hypothetical protein TNCV_4950571 [Trichonephila clavipes]|nr:hypothetical protein TNCV_4950571 [Trichonephila clavipes]
MLRLLTCRSTSIISVISSTFLTTSLPVRGSRDRIVKVWQLNSGELHASLKGHEATVSCVAFAPNGLFAVSGSDDCTLRVWGLTLGLIVSTFQGNEEVDALAKEGAREVVATPNCLTYLELYSARKHIDKNTWLAPRFELIPLAMNCDRCTQTAVSRFLSGHLKSFAFQGGH